MIVNHLIRLTRALALAATVATLAAPAVAQGGSNATRPASDWFETSIAAHSYGQGVIDTSLAPSRFERYPAARADGKGIVRKLGSCTMAQLSAQATVEVVIANASDFCELVSHALAGNVYRAPVLVTPGLLWHYAGAGLSCRLRYGNTRQLMTIRNSVAACRWLIRLAPDWHFETGTTAYAL
jgi:hypothetical protein